MTWATIFPNGFHGWCHIGPYTPEIMLCLLALVVVACAVGARIAK